MATRGGERDDVLIRVCDLAGRPRGTGFLAHADGTMITSHEAVDGLARLVLHAPGGQVCLVETGAITALPETGLALVATEGLALPPLPIAPGGPAHPERRTRLRLPHRTEGVVVGTTAATYTATDRFHLLDDVYELALDGADLNRVAPQASGAPLIDAATGAVLAVVVTAVQTGHRAGGFAVPLRARCAPAPLAELLSRNAATVPAYGPHLNLAGALQLTGASVAAARPGAWREPVDRPEVAAALGEFLAMRGESAPLALGLVGEPGTGRSTVLAQLAAERARGPHPAPTVWLRGAELRPGDGGVRDAVERALRSAARVVGAAPGYGGAAADPLGSGPADPTDAVAALARAAGRPLLVLLDAPEEMPPVLAHALADWSAGTARWLRADRARLIVACRPEFWEQAGALLPRELLHGAPAAGPPPGAPVRPLPPCVRLGDLGAGQAERARARYGLPEGALAEADAAHPLALRLLSEVRAAQPGDEPGVPPDGEDGPGAPPTRAALFSAHLDLMCLRIAVRLAAGSEPPLRGAAVRRLAARVAGQAHEAARRCLGPGQGELDRETFEELFPWRTGWASAVLTEGLLVPAGAGYRFAHEEQGDWLQALHLDLETALGALVHRWFAPPAPCPEAPVRLPSRPGARAVAWAGRPPPVPPAPPVAPPASPRSLPVPRHRAGPVLQALLLAPPPVLATHLHALVGALDRAAPAPTRWVPRPALESTQPSGAEGADTVPARRVRPQPPHGLVRVEPPGFAARRREAGWWAAHLVREALLRVPDAGPYREVLRALAGRIVVRAVAAGGFAAERLEGLGEFGPWFWRQVPLPVGERLELLRMLLPADGPPGPGERFLAVAAELLREQPAAALPVVCGWFGDDRPLRARLPGPDAPRLTVASAAQALLHTHRGLAVDDLTEALVTAGHPAADELLAALAEDEPSAVCRAVDRWAHDPRPERHVAAAAYGRRTAPFVRSAADRELLRYAALALLARPEDRALHGAALGLLVRDPATRDRHLPTALRHFASGDRQLPPSAVASALVTHPEPVLAAFQARLRAVRESADGGAETAEIMRELAAVTGHGPARRVTDLVQDYLRHRPGAARHVARYLDLRLEQGPAARALLLPFAAALVREHPPEVRRVLAPVFAAPGTRVSRPLRQELLDTVLEAERDPEVLVDLLTAAADGCRTRHPLLTRDLVHRLGLLLGRTPQGAARFDLRIVELAGSRPDFIRLLRAWLAEGSTWDALIGPSARRSLDTVA
ncbi:MULTISPECIES: trypsin-like peptidase domain-containing protein [unclassified Streptomyces]|uniref:trypsin-like peptidase domain-containing protein n=1 Tax=unclassified Streptomyces TaxID=2593676 RepID=UPI002E2A7096|nr:trypsin-like peptidase domain-containing protein [Streptomyces sp. NBC_00223]